MKHKITFSAVSLKYIALLAMTIDHIAFVFVPSDTALYFCMRLFGRLTAPIMSFFISEGFIHTSSRKKYLQRLLAFAVVSQPFYFLMVFSRPPENTFEFLTNLNVMFTLSSGLLSLMILSNEKFSVTVKVIFIGICFAFADICDWSYMIPLWVLIFFFFRNRKKLQILLFLCVALILIPMRYAPLFENFSLFCYNYGVILALIPLCLYNGKRGGKGKTKCRLLYRHIFYIYYPLHMAVISAIGFILK